MNAFNGRASISVTSPRKQIPVYTSANGSVTNLRTAAREWVPILPITSAVNNDGAEIAFRVGTDKVLDQYARGLLSTMELHKELAIIRADFNKAVRP